MSGVRLNHQLGFHHETRSTPMRMRGDDEGQRRQGDEDERLKDEGGGRE